MSENTSVEIRKACREYHRRWRAANPDKVAAINQRYWIRKAEQYKAEASGKDPENNETKGGYADD